MRMKYIHKHKTKLSITFWYMELDLITTTFNLSEDHDKLFGAVDISITDPDYTQDGFIIISPLLVRKLITYLFPLIYAKYWYYDLLCLSKQPSKV